MDELHIEWCRRLFAMLNEGGTWGVPRSGLMFRKEAGSFVLYARMPYLDELAEAHRRGEDVPASAEALRAYQDEDFEEIRRHFEAAGIDVRSEVE